MSGRKRMYVDQGEWSRLQDDARKLAAVRRDIPDLVDRVRRQTEENVDRMRAEIDTRQAGFDRALHELSAQNRQTALESERRLRDTSAAILAEVRKSESRQQRRTLKALQAQRAEFEQAIENERAERTRRMNEMDRQLETLRGEQGRAGELALSYLADTTVLRTHVLELAHERYRPGELDALDDRIATLRRDLERADPAYLLSGARDLYHAMEEFRAALLLEDAEWRAMRCAAETDLLRLQGVVEANASLDLGEAAGPTGERPDVDYWSRGAHGRLAAEITALLEQVHDDGHPPTADALRKLLAETVPNLDQRIDVVVGQAITALHASQLRANLADLIAEALDRSHYFQVVEGDVGYLDDDQRAAFLAKSSNRTGGGAIVIEVAPGTGTDGGVDDEKAPTVRLHNFDHGASEEERHARTEAIRASVLDSAGIDLGQAEEEARDPDHTRADVAALVASPESAEGRKSKTHGGPAGQTRTGTAGS